MNKYLDLNNYVKTGNLAVDMVCAAIIHERNREMYPSIIRLNAKYWDLFRRWVESNYGAETLEKEFLIDTVEVKKEVMYSGKTLTIEHHKPIFAQA